MSTPTYDEHHEFTLRRERGISVTVSCDGDANIAHVMEAFKSYEETGTFRPASDLRNEVKQERPRK